MTENEAIEKLHAYLECESRRAKIVSCNESCDDCELWYMQGTGSEHIASVETAIKALEEVQQYRAIGTVEECHEAVEKQTETLTVDKAKTIAAKAICIGCGYLADCKCDYNGGNCMVSKPMLESVLKSFDDWNGRANDGKTD